LGPHFNQHSCQGSVSATDTGRTGRREQKGQPESEELPGMVTDVLHNIMMSDIILLFQAAGTKRGSLEGVTVLSPRIGPVA
jgi:hypothetical protein